MTFGKSWLRKVRETGRQAMLELMHTPRMILPQPTSAHLMRLRLVRRTGPGHRTVTLTYGGRCMVAYMLAEQERTENLS